MTFNSKYSECLSAFLSVFAVCNFWLIPFYMINYYKSTLA